MPTSTPSQTSPDALSIWVDDGPRHHLPPPIPVKSGNNGLAERDFVQHDPDSCDE